MIDAIPGLRGLFSMLHPKANLQAFLEALYFLRNQRTLILSMASRDIRKRYAGQILGAFWAIGHPLFQMGVMVFVFAFVFKTRIGGTYEMPMDYIVYILSGLSAWLSFSPMLSSSSTSVTANANLIKQFTFDARMLPVTEVVAGALFWLVSVGVVIIYTLVVHGTLPSTYLLLPVLTAIHFMTALGCAWALAALSVFLRDIKDLITLLTTAMMYFLPIVYLPNWVPEMFRPFLLANPFSYMIWVYQDVFYFGRIEHPWSWLVAGIFAIFMFTSGYRLFRRLQPMFGGVL